MQQHVQQKKAVIRRKARQDKGKPQWTERNYYCLEWIGEQRAIRFDQLQRLLARESDQETGPEMAGHQFYDWYPASASRPRSYASQMVWKRWLCRSGTKDGHLQSRATDDA